MLALAAGALTAAVAHWPGHHMVEHLEQRTMDARFALRGSRAPSGQVVIVEIDDSSLALLGAWPWPRQVLGELVSALTRAGAQAIAFDILFAEPGGPGAGARSDALFADAIRRSGRVFLAAARAQEPGPSPEGRAPATRSPMDSPLERFALSGARVVAGSGLHTGASLYPVGAAISPLPSLASAARGVGFIDALPSRDGIYRYALPVLQGRDGLFPSLALALAADSLGVAPGEMTIRLGRSLELGPSRTIPLEDAGAMLINFAGPGRTFEYHPFADVMHESEADRARQFKGRIVLVAVTATGLYDLKASPFGAVFNGVEIQANALENILTGQCLRRQRPEVALLYTLCWTLLIGFFVPRMSAKVYVPVGSALLVLHNALAYWQFAARGVVVAVVAPTLGMGLSLVAVSAYWLITQEHRHRALQRTLSRFVPPELADHLAQEEELPASMAQRRIITALFADLRGFTAASARMDPEEIVTLLNHYFREMHEVILRFGGTVDKFVGDGIVAFFNAPTEQVDHAHLAVAAALEMHRCIHAHREEWAFHGMPGLAATMGISTGEAVVGYVGSGERVQYTAIGSEVNVAARLEELSKRLGTPVLISQATYDRVRDMVQCHPRGSFELHNVPEPVTVYEVLGMAAPEPAPPTG